jgi:hypothetical protein
MTAVLVLILRVALAAALYAFLGWALFTLWQELKLQGEILASRKKPGILLLAKLANGRELKQHFFQSEVTIGRDPNCDLPIMDEAISAHHARVSYHHSQWWLEDLNSTNGTFIGSSKVTVPTVLIPNDQFRCGNIIFAVQMESALSELVDQQQA